MTSGIFSAMPAVLPHVCWPLETIEDESLVGHIARTARHNAIGKLSVLTTDAGLPPHQTVGSIAASPHSLAGLGRMVVADEAWMSSREHRCVTVSESSNKPIGRFHGAIVRRAHLEYSRRLFSPTALQASEHHREAWHLATIAVDIPTWTFLCDACPSCQQTLGWRRTRGIAFCEHCGDSLAKAVPREVPVEWRQALSTASGLLSHRPDDQSAALARLPEILHPEDRGTLFELGWLLGMIGDEAYDLACVRPTSLPLERRAMAVARGFNFLAGWPGSLDKMLKETVDQDPTGVTTFAVVTRIRRTIKRASTFGRASEILGERLGKFYTNGCSTTIGKALGYYTATTFTNATGLSTEHIASLRREKILDAVILKERTRALALYPPSALEKVRASMAGRRSARDCAFTLGIGVDAVLMLFDMELLQRSSDPIINHIYRKPHADQTSLELLRASIERSLRQCSDCETMQLSTALRTLPPKAKPWGHLIQWLTDGKLRVFREFEGPLNLRKCRIAVDDLRLLHALPPPTDIDGPDMISAADAMERLNCSYRNVQELRLKGALKTSGSLNGETFLREDVDHFADQFICVAEIRARLGVQNQYVRLDQLWSEARLVQDENGFFPRVIAEERLHLF